MLLFVGASSSGHHTNPPHANMSFRSLCPMRQLVIGRISRNGPKYKARCASFVDCLSGVYLMVPTGADSNNRLMQNLDLPVVKD